MLSAYCGRVEVRMTPEEKDDFVEFLLESRILNETAVNPLSLGMGI